MQEEQIKTVFDLINVPVALSDIARKVVHGERVTPSEGIMLFEQGELGFLGKLADMVRPKEARQAPLCSTTKGCWLEH